MAQVRELTADDVDWAVSVLAAGRAALKPFAPLYWRPAADATMRHADFLHWILGDGGGVGLRTDDSLMIAARDRGGWTVDDAWVPPAAWAVEGAALWRQVERRIRTGGIDASDGDMAGSDASYGDAAGVDAGGGDASPRGGAGIDGGRIQFVCPVFEPERTRFALDRGLVLARSWWHREVDATSPRGARAAVPRIAGAVVDLVPAPPIYDPGGPITFLRDVTDERALDGAPEEARRCGSPLVVVDQPAASRWLADALAARGYVRHCDFFVTA